MLKKPTVATDRGARSYQEDQHVVKHVDYEKMPGVLMAVADGHGGTQTSSYVVGRLQADLFDSSLAYEKGDPLNALKKIFKSLNEETSNLGNHQSSGTTLSAVYVPDGKRKAYVGVIGDSPVILAKRKTSDFDISPEHNVRSNAKEKEAAVGRGGVVRDGYLWEPTLRLGLQMSRDIGYHGMGDVLLRYPDVYTLDMEEGDALIVGTDGLLDPGHRSTREEARRLAKLVLGGAEASDLVQDALGRQTGDNVTAIVYRV